MQGLVTAFQIHSPQHLGSLKAWTSFAIEPEVRRVDVFRVIDEQPLGFMPRRTEPCCFWECWWEPPCDGTTAQDIVTIFLNRLTAFPDAKSRTIQEFEGWLFRNRTVTFNEDSLFQLVVGSSNNGLIFEIGSCEGTIIGNISALRLFRKLLQREHCIDADRYLAILSQLDADSYLRAMSLERFFSQNYRTARLDALNVLEILSHSIPNLDIASVLSVRPPEEISSLRDGDARAIQEYEYWRAMRQAMHKSCSVTPAPLSRTTLSGLNFLTSFGDGTAQIYRGSLGPEDALHQKTETEPPFPRNVDDIQSGMGRGSDASRFGIERPSTGCNIVSQFTGDHTSSFPLEATSVKRSSSMKITDLLDMSEAEKSVGHLRDTALQNDDNESEWHYIVVPDILKEFSCQLRYMHQRVPSEGRARALSNLGRTAGGGDAGNGQQSPFESLTTSPLLFPRTRGSGRMRQPMDRSFSAAGARSSSRRWKDSVVADVHSTTDAETEFVLEASAVFPFPAWLMAAIAFDHRTMIQDALSRQTGLTETQLLDLEALKQGHWLTKIRLFADRAGGGSIASRLTTAVVEASCPPRRFVTLNLRRTLEVTEEENQQGFEEAVWRSTVRLVTELSNADVRTATEQPQHATDYYRYPLNDMKATTVRFEPCSPKLSSRPRPSTERSLSIGSDLPELAPQRKSVEETESARSFAFGSSHTTEYSRMAATPLSCPLSSTLGRHLTVRSGQYSLGSAATTSTSNSNALMYCFTETGAEECRLHIRMGFSPKSICMISSELLGESPEIWKSVWNLVYLGKILRPFFPTPRSASPIDLVLRSIANRERQRSAVSHLPPTLHQEVSVPTDPYGSPFCGPHALPPIR